MGAIGGLLGLDGGSSGTGFAGPTGQVQNPTSMDQINDSYRSSQFRMLDQQRLLSALTAQNGLQNQSNVYNQLSGIASGTGPNPAQAQYQQNIQNLAKQQSGAIASQKGISPALATRMISQQGSGAMQNAAGQGAVNLANQQLGAMGAMGNIAGSQIANQVGQTNANAQAYQNEQQMLLNAQSSANATSAGLQSNINSVNGGLAQTGMQGQQNMIGGFMQGAGAMMGMAGGGEVGGAFTESSGPQSKFGQFVTKGAVVAPPPIQMGLQSAGPNLTKDAFDMSGKKKKQAPENAGQGPTQQNAMQIPFNQPISQQFGLGFGAAPVMAMGGMTGDYRSGGNVRASGPRQKAVKGGDSYANDKIPAVLSEGEVVIPRSVMQSRDPVRASADFIARIIAKRRGVA